jgi:hypothetical protein
MFQPWLAHLFPGLTLRELHDGNWTLSGFVGMGDLARER